MEKERLFTDEELQQVKIEKIARKLRTNWLYRRHSRERINSSIQPTKVPSEIQFFNIIKSQGWTPVKRGWPDYLCYKDGKIILVEVKSKSFDGGMSPFQKFMTAVLSANGLECYRWTAETGLIPLRFSNEDVEILLQKLLIDSNEIT